MVPGNHLEPEAGCPDLHLWCPASRSAPEVRPVSNQVNRRLLHMEVVHTAPKRTSGDSVREIPVSLIRRCFTGRNLALALTLLTALLAPWAAVYPHGLSGDIWWLLTVGHYDLAHHTILSRNYYSYTSPRESWVDVEWGWQVFAAWLQGVFGVRAIWLLSAGIIDLVALAVAYRLHKRGASSQKALILALWCTLAVVGTYDRARAVVLSFLIFTALLWILDQAKSKNGRWLFALPPLFALWANVHGSYLLGLTVLDIEVVLAKWGGRLEAHIGSGRLTIPRLRLRSAILALIGALIGVCVNPWGLQNPLVSVRLATNPQIATFIEEWQSPNFHNYALLFIVGLPILVTVISLIHSDHPVRADDLILVGLLLAATLVSVRMLPYYIIAWAGLASAHPLPELKPRLWVLAAAVWVAAASVGILVTPPIESMTAESSMPVTLMTAASATGGRIFTTYRTEDWAVSKHIPVFIDGRADLYVTGHPSIFMQFIDTASGVDPGKTLNRWDIKNVVFHRVSALSSWLSNAPNWRLMKTEGGWVWYERKP